MSDPILRLGFTDTFKNCQLFFIDILSRRYDVILDNINPDYLIFGDTNFGYNHKSYDRTKVTKIFYTGENVRPNYNDCDHAITFDFVNSPKHYRLPLYALEMWAIVTENKFTEEYYYLMGLHKKFDWEKEYDSKTIEFTYVQSNPYCYERTSLVKDLLKMGVDIKCGGPHLNNIGQVIPRDRLLKMDFLKKGKINIAMENGAYPGYVTEKLIDAFYSNTLPYYWGSELIERDFNSNCFLKETELVVDKNTWCEKMSQPRFNYDIPNEYCQLDNFLNWFGECVYHA